ncbi:MAG: LysM peptidoglycan-binding domain-containing protein [Verrucomicrobia bacterium]|nr:LysM peptidoglycan-binding domain-containing protein [Verrucomicrobiota bacterium]
MIPVRLHLLPIFLLAGMITLRSSAQTAPVVKPRIEPGLENAVDWQWIVLPSDEKSWGLQINAPESPPEEVKPGVPGISPTISIKPVEARPTEYVVKSGDALGIISRKYGMTVLQLKTFNGLTKDTIRIGQTLKIPTLEEIKAMLPPPPEPKPEIAEKEVPKAAPKAKPGFLGSREVPDRADRW